MSRNLSLAEVAHRLGVHPETARRWALTKVIPAFRIHKRGRWHFSEEEIDNFLKQRQSFGTPEQGQGATN